MDEEGRSLRHAQATVNSEFTALPVNRGRLICAKWWRQVLDYNVPGGKLNRGMAVLDALKAVLKGKVRWPRQPDLSIHQPHCPQWARSLLAMGADRCLPPRPQEVTQQQEFDANLVGWCIELVRAGP